MTPEQKELGDRVLRFIEDNPDKWDQTAWHACFAGHTVWLSNQGWSRAKTTYGDSWEYSESFIVRDGERRRISEVAMELLGIEANRNYGYMPELFFEENTLADLKRLWEEAKSEA